MAIIIRAGEVRDDGEKEKNKQRLKPVAVF